MSSSSHTVVETTVTPRLTAGVRARVPMGRVGEFFGRNLDQVYAAGHTGAIDLDGQNIFIYRYNPEGDLTVDFCVGVTKPFEAVGNVTPVETPSGIAASTTHWGDYSGLRAANDAIKQWCRDNNRTLAGVSWEVYGHWSNNPAELRTDVYWLLK